jgi:hypothetical protein
MEYNSNLDFQLETGRAHDLGETAQDSTAVHDGVYDGRLLPRTRPAGAQAREGDGDTHQGKASTVDSVRYV